VVIHTVIRGYLTYRYLVGSTEGLGIGELGKREEGSCSSCSGALQR